MTRDMLYEAAFRYKKAGLWKKLWDNEVFAIKLSSGEIGYICVMGKNGEFCSLGLYIGKEGFQSYRIIQNAPVYSGSPFKDHEVLMQQKCLQMSLEVKDALMPEEVDEVLAYGKKNGIKFTGKNAFPQFCKYEPNFFPWKIKTKEDMKAIHEAMEASTLLADLLKTVAPKDIGIIRIDEDTEEVPLFEVKDGKLLQAGMAPLPLYEERHYEVLEVHNDILVAKTKKLPKKGIWEAELVRMMEPAQEEPDEAPFYPLLLLVVESKSFYILPVPLFTDVEEKPNEFFQTYASAWKSQGLYPKEIRCRDERTYALLKDFSDKTGVKIKVYDGIMEALDDAEDELLYYTSGEETPEDVADQMAEVVDMILDLSSAEIRQMPPVLLEQLKMMIENDIFPQEIAAELKKKLKNV